VGASILRRSGRSPPLSHGWAGFLESRRSRFLRRGARSAVMSFRSFGSSSQIPVKAFHPGFQPLPYSPLHSHIHQLKKLNIDRHNSNWDLLHLVMYSILHINNRSGLLTYYCQVRFLRVPCTNAETACVRVRFPESVIFDKGNKIFSTYLRLRYIPESK